jgi:L,D-transpeptidase YbiS
MINHSEKHVHAPLLPESPQLLVRISRQTMEVVHGRQVMTTYPVSTSKFGPGFEPGSFKTPLGRFIVSKKFGRDAPAGTVFKARCPTGEIAGEGGEEDLILTRILWLEGLDPKNANTRDRYIYIHGTNHESQIGSPASCGCVRMRNEDIIAIFDQIAEGTQVEIFE